jgi:hypothetical protein
MPHSFSFVKVQQFGSLTFDSALASWSAAATPKAFGGTKTQKQNIFAYLAYFAVKNPGILKTANHAKYTNPESFRGNQSYCAETKNCGMKILDKMRDLDELQCEAHKRISRIERE